MGVCMCQLGGGGSIHSDAMLPKNKQKNKQTNVFFFEKTKLATDPGDGGPGESGAAVCGRGDGRDRGALGSRIPGLAVPAVPVSPGSLACPSPARAEVAAEVIGRRALGGRGDGIRGDGILCAWPLPCA
jgi:hypothetical protein